jgi:hypothetical protein
VAAFRAGPHEAGLFLDSAGDVVVMDINRGQIGEQWCVWSLRGCLIKVLVRSWWWQGAGPAHFLV